MGLDMYFQAEKIVVYKLYTTYRQKEGEKDLTNYPADLQSLADYIFERNFKDCTVIHSWQIGYFRGFTALHQYIVDHYSKQADHNRPVTLLKTNIVELLDLMNEVLINKDQAGELLPDPNAYAYLSGTTPYDEYYFDNVKEAKKLFKLILNSLDFRNYDVVYRASR